jgi:small GTP-binding protein
VGKSAIFLRQQRGVFEPEAAVASMGAHFAQKVVEIEEADRKGGENGMKASITGSSIMNMNTEVEDPNKKSIGGQYLTSAAQQRANSDVGNAFVRL